MWSYKITNKDNQDNNGLRVDVVFTNGTLTFTRKYYPTGVEALKTMIKGDLDKFTNQEVIANEISADLGGLDPVAVPPTGDEIAADKYRDDVIDMGRLKKAIALGLIDTTNAYYVTVLGRLTNKYKKEYLPFFDYLRGM